MDEHMTDQFPVLQGRRTGLIDNQKVDEVSMVSETCPVAAVKSAR
jgi:hypothetical protein